MIVSIAISSIVSSEFCCSEVVTGRINTRYLLMLFSSDKFLYNYHIMIHMAEVHVLTRKWGNSLGITIPNDVVKREALHENQKVVVEIKKVVDVRRLRGLVRFKKSAQEIKDEMRRGWK